MADYTDAQRKMFAKSGVSMPDGSYPIANGADLENAIKTVGLGDNPDAEIKAHIIKRATKLDLLNKIPEKWADDHAELGHHGVKGMHWGVKRSSHSVTTGSGKTHEFKYNPKHVIAKSKKKLDDRNTQIKEDKSRGVSNDAAKAIEAKRVAKNAGTTHLSNAELQHLVNRMNLEEQYQRLTKGQNVTIETRAANIVKSVGLQKATVAKNSPTSDVVSKAIQESFSGPSNGKKGKK